MSKFIANSFQVPNALIDEMLDKISGNACKIYLLIVRKTRGWNKEADRLSYSQIQKSTGIGSYATIDKALSELVKTGLIFVKSGNEKSANEYRLNDCFAFTETVKGITENEIGGITETVTAFTETVKGGITETVNTEIQYIKNTNNKYKSEYTHDEHTHENSQNAKKTAFVKPSIDEVKTYFTKINPSTEQLAVKFFLFYEANGWVVGKTPMQNWQAAAQRWLLDSGINPTAKTVEKKCNRGG